MKNNVRLASIDVLRGVAALIIVFAHAVTFSDSELRFSPSIWLQSLFSLASWGSLGVPLFFVISGFCIHAQFARGSELGEQIQPKFIQFWKRRFFRLYPSYFVALTISMALLAIAFAMKRNVPTLNAYPALSWHWLGLDYLSHLTMLHGLIPFFDEGGGNPSLWTIAREEYLYLLYFPLLAMRRQTGIKCTVFFTLILGMAVKAWGVYYLGASHVYHSVVVSSALALWFQWSIGALAAELVYGRTSLPSIFSSPVTGLALFAFSAWLTIQNSFFSDYTWGLCFFTLINYFVKAELRYPSMRNNPVVRIFAFFGLRSYSIYLLHNPVKSVARAILGPFGTTNTEFIYLLSALAILLAGLGVGCVLFTLVERHSLIRPPANEPSLPTALS